MTTNQANILAAIKSQLSAKRRWLNASVLDCYDGRSVAGLVRKGLIEVNADYGVRA